MPVDRDAVGGLVLRPRRQARRSLRRSNGPITSASAAANSTRPMSRSGTCLPTNKKVGVLYPNDADGNAIRENLAPALAKAGFTIVDPGPYEDGTTDYSAQIAKFKAEKCEIFNTFPIPPDFAAFWRQAAQQGYTKMVKIAQIAKTGLFPVRVEALGNLGHNLASAAYWHKAFPYKSSADRRQRRRARRRLREGLGQAVDAAARRDAVAVRRRLRRAQGERRSQRQGGRRQGDVDPEDDRRSPARSTSPAGPVPNVSPGPIIGTQWVKAPAGSKFKLDYVVTENATDPNVPIAAKLMPYNG